jgi:hypothetical protein
MDESFAINDQLGPGCDMDSSNPHFLSQQLFLFSFEPISIERERPPFPSSFARQLHRPL